MVNTNNGSMKKIISILTEADGYVSGESIAETLKISRVAVWKHVSSLREAGYQIDSGRRGYMLRAAADKPFPWEMSGAGMKIEYLRSTASTMRRAAVISQRREAGGTTVIAGVQTGGIDRDGKPWQSPEGGLYLTRIRTTPLPAADADVYLTACCEAAAGVLNRLFGDSFLTVFQPPNRLEAAGRIIGAVLTEFTGSLGLITGINTGVGIYANVDAERLPSGCISISELTGVHVSEKKLAADLISALTGADSRFAAPGDGFSRDKDYS